MRRGGQVSSLRCVGIASTALLAALLVLAVGARAAPARLKPPRIWSGTVSGSDTNPFVGTTTTWTADVRFELVGVTQKGRNFSYVGTGSASYEIHGGNLCTSTGQQTYAIGGNDAGLNVIHTRSGWKYAIEITLIGEDFIGQVYCPDQPVEDETEYLPEPLITDRRSRPVPRGLSSISGSSSEGGHYTTTWSFSGTPRR